MKKKFLALVMTLSMVLSLVPMTALATEDQPTAEPTQEATSSVNTKVEDTEKAEEEQGEAETPSVQATPQQSPTKVAVGTTFSSDDLNYNVLSNDTVQITGCVGEITELVIPEKVTYEENEYTIVSIADEAFYINKNLTRVNFNNVSIDIGLKAFCGCSELQEVVGADALTEIGDAAFLSCKKLETVSNLSKVTSIGYQSFMNCWKLTKLEGLKWSALTHIGDNAFFSCELLSLILDEDTFKSLSSLGKRAFNNDTAITGTVVLPESITEIPESAFSNTGITDVDFSHITSIGNGAFKNCAGLTELKLSDSVTAIGDSAFSGTGISGELVLPDSITKIGSDAFNNVKITGSLVLPKSLITLGGRAFRMTGIGDVTIPGTLKIIGPYSFYGCQNLSNVVFSEGVETIGTAAFTKTGLISVNLPDSLEEIGEGAFSTCQKLTSVQVGTKDAGLSNLKSIGSKAFNKDTELKELCIETSQANVNIPKNTSTAVTIPDTVTVRFSVSANGENIRTDKNTTLQEDIDAVANNGQATLIADKGFSINETITIPSGKTITLTSEQKVYVLSAQSTGPVFKVEEGATLILDKNLSFPCHLIANGVFAEVNGTLTIKDNVSISRFSSSAGDTGVIDVNNGGSFKMEGGTISEITGSVSGYGAVYVRKGGTFIMNGGKIADCTVKSQYSGAVVLDEGTMTMKNGEIDGNTATEFNSAGGVLVNKTSTFTMTGGTISNNRANRGGGVLVRENGTFTMTGGTISGNTARVQDSSIDKPNAGGGGVFVEHNASFDMENGTITGNTTNGMGGGVATAVLNENDKTGGGKFHMTGGTISNNKASCGGGVYSWSKTDRVVLEGGNIVNNTASIQGGGVYVSTSPYGLTIKNALITDNTAKIMGGGVWACPTGTVTLGTDSAVFDNTAEKAGDDIALLNKNEGYYSTFSNEQLGGGLVTWYKDNFVTGNSGQWGLHGDYRYDANDPGNPVISATKSMSSYSLKAVVSNDGKSLARNAAKLFIQGNTAQRGGGVGTNGEINFSGDNTPKNPISVTVHKVWSGNSGNDPSTVTVNLVRTKEDKSQTIATVILSEKSKDKEDTPEEKGKTWSYTFSNLDDSYTYTVTEDEVPGYRTSITKNTEGNNLSFTITNTRKGGSGGGTVTIPDDVPTGLDLKNHYGYIIGYPVDYYTGKPTTDQTKKPVRPEGKITRAEVATIYFRMLTDENRAANWNQVSGFSDVKSSAWYNNAISTLTKAGILKGYEDGTFQPDGYITRAEFATIAIRFFSGVYEGEDLFPDIKGHWAEDYINNAANKGLVKGYEDGTFGPDRYITRAEAVTLVNRTLNRHPHNDGLHQDMLRWPDNMDTSKWYYADMQEATNSHEPDKNKSTADKEYWGKMLPIRDWEALEKEWSNANSAPGEGEVV